MTEQQARFLGGLCRWIAKASGKRVADDRDVGMEVSLSLNETDSTVQELEIDGFVFTTPGGAVWLTSHGSAFCQLRSIATGSAAQGRSR